MATDNTSRSGGAVRGLASTGLRLALDLFVVTCWVVFLTLLFLENPWPRWAFYGLLVIGVGLYVALTPTWGRSRGGTGGNDGGTDGNDGDVARNDDNSAENDGDVAENDGDAAGE